MQNCVDKTYCLQKQDIVHSLKTGSVSRDFKTFIFFMNGTHLISRLKTNFYFVSLSTIIDRKVSVNHFFLTFLRACAKLYVRVVAVHADKDGKFLRPSTDFQVSRGSVTRLGGIFFSRTHLDSKTVLLIISCSRRYTSFKFEKLVGHIAQNRIFKKTS